MKLNCKPNQLAIKIKSGSGDMIPVGAVVLCKTYGLQIRAGTNEEFPAWVVEYMGSTFSPQGNYWAVRDEYLRPIRDSDGEDETLTWAGKPEGVTA